jgi:hypothetical protein
MSSRGPAGRLRQATGSAAAILDRVAGATASASTARRCTAGGGSGTSSGDMTKTAWVRIVRRLPRNRELVGEGPDLREFLFGSDRTALGTVRRVLREPHGGRCFYCAAAIRGEPVVDHFVPGRGIPSTSGRTTSSPTRGATGRRPIGWRRSTTWTAGARATRYRAGWRRSRGTWCRTMRPSPSASRSGPSPDYSRKVGGAGAPVC